MLATLGPAALLTAALAVAAPSARAQVGAPPDAPFGGAVPAGARVRVALPDSVRQAPLAPRRQVVIGTVTGVAGDTLVLTVPGAGGALRVARADLRALAVSRGVPGRAESALRRGAGAALLLGLTFLALHAQDDDRRFGSAGGAAAVGAGVGFGFGAVLGAVSPSERWRAVRLR